VNDAEHVRFFETQTKGSIITHLSAVHGYERDDRPHGALLHLHQLAHMPKPDAHEISDKTQVPTDTVVIAEDGPPGTEDVKMTVMAEAQANQRVATLEATIARMEREQRAQVQLAIESYKAQVIEKVRYYVDRGDLCKPEAKKIAEDLELNMTFGWKLTGTIEFDVSGIDEEVTNGYSLEDALANAVREVIGEYVVSDDLDFNTMNVDTSCDEDDD
jgi:hypothetical protein